MAALTDQILKNEGHPLQLEPATALLFGIGGAGNAILASANAHADGDPAIAFIGVDVVADPPAVYVKRNGSAVAVSLERRLQYIRAGVDMDVAKLWTDARRSHRARTLAARIVSRSRTAPPSSVEIGTEARRQLGFAALAWSRAEIELAVERAVRRLGDVRLTDAAGNVVTQAPMNVLFVTGIAGGVGSGMIFPMIGIVKQVMARAGIPLHRSLFSLLAVGPSAFPQTDLRLSNAFETLRDLEIAQRRAVVLCKGGLDESFGPPVNVLLIAGTATEQGKTLRTNEELFPILGKFCHAYATSRLGVSAIAHASNSFGLVNSATTDGERRMFGSPAFLEVTFDGAEVVAEHAAPRLTELVLGALAAADDPAAAVQLEAEAAGVSHFDDETVLLTHAQNDDDGAQQLRPFDKELAAAWGKKRPKIKVLATELVQADETYGRRVATGVNAAAVRLEAASNEYSMKISDYSKTLLNSVGPSAAASFTEASSTRLAGMLNVLSAQRSAIREDLAETASLTAAALAELEERLRKGGAYWRHRKAIQETIGLLTDLHAISYAFGLTEHATMAVAAARDLADRRTTEMRSLAHSMARASLLMKDRWAGYETRPLSPSDELTDRPLANSGDLRGLYGWAVEARWDDPGDLVRTAVRQAFGDLATWLGISAEDVGSRAVTAVTRTFTKIAAMGADEFLRWKFARTGVGADVMLRDLFDLSPGLYRFDRSRLPDDDTMYDENFTLVGVFDRDTSVFAGTGLGELASTGDRTHISLLRLRLGLPASALFDFDRMQDAYNKVKERGDVVVDIYPELYTHQPTSTASKAGRRKGGRRAK